MDLKQLPEDFYEFLKSLQKYHIDYLLVGGWAMGVYAEPRFTGDIDFLVRVSPDSLFALQNALHDFGAPPIEEESFSILGNAYCIGRRPLRIEILNQISGVEFSEAWSRRNTVTVNDLQVHVISRADLIRNKRAAGRAKDFADLESLGESPQK